MKKLMQNNELKIHGKYISYTVSKIMKNIGKYQKFTLPSEDEYIFFNEIKPIIENKFQSKVNINFEKDSTEQKAAHALPGKPAIIIS